MRVVTTEEMKGIERSCIESAGFSESLIIENIGVRGAQNLHEKFLRKKDYGEILVLVGAGYNGCDGLAIARQLTNLGYKVRAFILFPEDIKSDELKKQILMAEKFGVRVDPTTKVEQLSSYFEQTNKNTFILDAILGTGVRLPLSEYIFDVINLVNEQASLVVSIDMPTGICSDTGRKVGIAVFADHTFAIALPKIGHYMGDGPKHIGELAILDGGIPKKLLKGGSHSLLQVGLEQEHFSIRNKFAHKNAFGHTLVVGGSFGLTGAVVMAAEAALKVGTGLVTAVTWPENYQELHSSITAEVMTGVIPNSDVGKKEEIALFSRYDCIIVGPGLGHSESARAVVLGVLSNFHGPVVLDADAINCLSLAADGSLLSQRKAPTILTPHIGELARFLATPKKNLLENPLGYLKEVVETLNSTVIVKGPCTYLGFPDGKRYINYFPNDGMATAGTGDVLAGILGGLLAQTNPKIKEKGIFRKNSGFYEAVKYSVLCHTLAGKYAAIEYGTRSMTAKSIIESFPSAFKEIEKGEEKNANC